ncbi:hypothetical protein GCM10023196_046750 [Actinoallomurus vinaceus]|uniref:Uncharacterized protein n=1 Tax=Actinoallomurus vinaceus TaxID=1080074 RepID=A0ABP8UCM5_9ACTN
MSRQHPPRVSAFRGDSHPLKHPRPDGRERSRRGRVGIQVLTHSPAVFIVTIGALWASVSAPHDPMVMWPTAAWLWLTALFLIRRSLPARKRVTRVR